MKVAMVLIQEPYVGNTGRVRGYHGVRMYQNLSGGSGTVKASIAVLDDGVDVLQCPELTTENITVVKVRTKAWTIAVASYYFEPDQPIEPYLVALKAARRATKNRLIIAGDANAKSIWWGSREDNQRGEQMYGALTEMDMQVLNSGNVPTFDTIRGGVRYSSHVDVTACTEDILNLVVGWRVMEGLTCSDHNAIFFRVNLRRSKGINIERTTRRYNSKKANWSLFREKLTQVLLSNNLTDQELNKIKNKKEIDKVVIHINEAIAEACNETIPLKKTKEILTIPWWSKQLEKLKKEVTTRRRRIRSAAPNRRQMVVSLYLKQKETYEKAVKEAMERSWKDFCGRQDREGMWDSIYRVIGRTTEREEDRPLVVGGRVLDPKESARCLAETFYPSDGAEGDSEEHRSIRNLAETVNDGTHGEHVDPPFTMGELRAITSTFNPKKAPGVDGFTADICAHAVDTASTLFLTLVNLCLAHCCFPKPWKEAVVVILRKPGKDDYGSPKAYRPIGLLPVMGKIYEKLLVSRLKFYLLPRISTRQFGFMPQKGTEDALVALTSQLKRKRDSKRLVTLVSLDIEGAFDSAWWPAIKVRLAEEKCPINLRRVISDYLSDRSVEVRYAGEKYRKATEKGCVQGSIGGPILWNLLLDPLLRQLESRGFYCQAFADDVVLVFDGKEAREIEEQANAALEHVREWGVRNKLRFAPHKTCAMVITRKLVFDTPRLRMGGVSIEMSSEIKILGLTIDKGLTFNKHVANACKRAAGIYKRLVRAARINWGLSPAVIRTIYTAAVEPVVLYAAAAWAPAAGKLGVRKSLNSVQRGFAQKMCKAYRTVSLNSALLLTGILPSRPPSP